MLGRLTVTPHQACDFAHILTLASGHVDQDLRSMTGTFGCLHDAPAQCRVARLTDDVAVDYDAQDEVVGVEVLHARRVLGGGGTPVVELQNVVGRPSQG